MFTLWQHSTSALSEESKAVFAAYQGGDFVDIGAFNGWYSLLLAPKARPGDAFVSVEPDPACRADLATTLQALRRIYPDTSFRQIEGAVGDGSLVNMIQPQGRAGHPSFRSTSEDDAKTDQRSLTLDQLVQQSHLNPALIKVDVEGAEYEVLQGARNTLQRFHPMLMTELHPAWLPERVSINDIAEYLRNFGYSSTPIDEAHLIWK